jgi:hypothetical protein
MDADDVIWQLGDDESISGARSARGRGVWLYFCSLRTES